MRCSCHQCDTYMAQSEGLELGCVCPNCGYRCKACLGTNSVVSRDALKSLSRDPSFLNEIFSEPESTPNEELAPERDEYLD